MHNPLDDDLPQPKSVSTISILLQSRLVKVTLLIAVLSTSVYMIPSLITFLESLKNDRKDYSVFQSLVLRILFGCLTALTPIAWLCLSTRVESPLKRAILGWCLCHLCSLVLLMGGMYYNPTLPSLNSILSLGFTAYILYLTQAFFLYLFLQIAPLKLAWKSGLSWTKLNDEDRLSFALVAAVCLGEGGFIFYGFLYNLSWLPFYLLFLYSIVCWLASSLVALGLGSFFSNVKWTYRIAFVAAMVVCPVLIAGVLRLQSDTYRIYEPIMYSFAMTWAFAFTSLLGFVTLKTR